MSNETPTDPNSGALFSVRDSQALRPFATRKDGKTPSGRISCLWYLDQTVSIYAESAQTGGFYGLLVGEVPKLSGPPPHIHSHEDEGFFIASGHLHAWCGDEFFDLPTESFVFLPKGLVHWFQAVSDEIVTLVTVVSPGGHEEMFRRSAWGPAKDIHALPPALREYPAERVIAAAASVGVTVQPMYRNWAALKAQEGEARARGERVPLLKELLEQSA